MRHAHHSLLPHRERPRRRMAANYPVLLAQARRRLRQHAEDAGCSLLDGLVACWPMNEASGSRLDVSGQANHLTSNNSVGSTEGLLGDAAALNSASNHSLSIGSNPSLSFGNQAGLSLAMWFNFSPLDTYKILASKWGATIPEMEFNLQVYAPAYDYIVDWQVSDGVDYFSVQTTDIIGDGWWHVVATFDAAAGELQIWLNGVASPLAGSASLVTAAATPIVLGAYSTFTGQSTLLIDDTAIWNRRLSAGEVAMLWNDGDGLAYPFS